MADISQLERALINADAAGDAGAARELAAEIQRARSQAQPTPQPVGRLEKIGMGAADPIHGGAQLLTQMLPEGVVSAGNRFNNWLADKTGLVARLPEGGVDQQVRERETEYQRQRAAAGESGFDGYRTIGNVVSPANIAFARLMPGAAAALTTKMGVGALGGAASAALSPVTEGDFSGGKAMQIASGAGFGAATPAVVHGVARAISPKASVNPKLQMLKQEGVKPTIGQTLGGAWNAAEEKAQSLPLVGDLISYNRRRAVEQFNNAAINRAVAPIGQKVDGVGTDAVRKAGDLISDAYDSAKAQLGAFRIDNQANSELSRLRMMATAGGALEGRERTAFNKYFSDYLGNRALTADKFKELDSKITNDIAKFTGSSDAYQQKLGDALKEVQRIINENARRANPAAAKALDAADAAYANLVRVEGAAVGGKAAEGVFTPGQLLTAVRGADKTVRDRGTGRGTALMQDLAVAGQAVLGNKVPDSGTAGRLGYAGLGALGMYDPMLTSAGLGTGLFAYAPPVQTFLRGAVSARPEFAQPVAKALKKAAPTLIPAGSQVGLGLLQY